MKTLNVNQLREWAKGNGFKDSWWFSQNGTVSMAAEKLAQVPKDGTVHVLNADARGTDSEEWICFRYPGYKTPEEIAEATERRRQANALTEKQKVALEFMGHPTENLSKAEASDLLDKGFNAPGFQSEAYDAFKWERRNRIYSKAEILSILFERAQSSGMRIQIAEAKKKKAIEEALSEGIGEEGFLPYLTTRFPEFFVSEATQRRKEAERQRNADVWRDMSAFESTPHRKPAGQIRAPGSRRESKGSKSGFKRNIWIPIAVGVAVALLLAVLLFIFAP